MATTRWEKETDAPDVKMMHRNDDFAVFHIPCNDGNAISTRFQVFPGIELVYNDIHTQQCNIEEGKSDNIIVINHCREGRIEYEVEEEFFYLSQGDISISRKRDLEHGCYFPNSHYHGLTIIIDVDRAPDCLSCFLAGINVQPTVLVEKFCKEGPCFVMRANRELEHIFFELYSVPESIRQGYFKVKVLEILLFLSIVKKNEEMLIHHSIPKSQVALAKQVCRYLSEHMDSRFTIEQIADNFHVSSTLIKTSFKSVYGTSLYAFIRTQKMREAALLLRSTNQTVLDIAGQFGYDNGSKFAKAFREIIGITPTRYRNLEKTD